MQNCRTTGICLQRGIRRLSPYASAVQLVHMVNIPVKSGGVKVCGSSHVLAGGSYRGSTPGRRGTACTGTGRHLAASPEDRCCTRAHHLRGIHCTFKTLARLTSPEVGLEAPIREERTHRWQRCFHTECRIYYRSRSGSYGQRSRVRRCTSTQQPWWTWPLPCAPRRFDRRRH